MTTDRLIGYPESEQREIDFLLAEEIAKNPHKIVVLDDDPTGTQTIHDVSVYTDWSEQSIDAGFREKNKLFYILTNSRAMSPDETTAVHREIGAAIRVVAAKQKKPYLIILRGDSTLRGHYPLETQILRESIECTGTTVDGEILCPFFQEGGRFTLNNTHYVHQGAQLIPAAETEFAKDKTFGFTQSNLPRYIQEKTKGTYRAEDVVCISLKELRATDYDGITERLLSVRHFQKVVVNATDIYDVKVFCIALYRAIARGKLFLFRTAASFVKAIGGIPNRPLLTKADMIQEQNTYGGIVVVGSHTQRTTQQLEQLLNLDQVEAVPFDSNILLRGEEAFDREAERCRKEAEKIIRHGKTAVCYTSRTLLEVAGDTKETALKRSVKISDGVQRLVGELNITPAFVVAKGGITSSDVAKKALGIQKAVVLGQIQPGIPVWKTGTECKFKNIPYIIFPGNTGNQDTLRNVVQILSQI